MILIPAVERFDRANQWSP